MHPNVNTRRHVSIWSPDAFQIKKGRIEMHVLIPNVKIVDCTQVDCK